MLPSGQGFVMFEGKTETRETSRAKVVIGWFQELERLTKGGGRQPGSSMAP